MDVSLGSDFVLSSKVLLRLPSPSLLHSYEVATSGDCEGEGRGTRCGRHSLRGC